MIITDLNHIEVVSTEEGSIMGAGKYYYGGASASATALAAAAGIKFAGTSTFTETIAIFGGKKGGAIASSVSSSSSVAG